MIKIENTCVDGFEAAIRGMRNPLNSWDKSDSKRNETTGEYEVGSNDFSLMEKLVNAGSDHSKFMRMITVSCDITAPIFWWKEADTYKVGTVRNSCSTMHKIHSKEFTKEDFSFENILPDVCDVNYILGWLNYARDRFLETKDKKYWRNMIEILPSSYNQRSTWIANYAVLRNIYHARKNHKLGEWHTFCNWIESLPYSSLITNRG